MKKRGITRSYSTGPYNKSNGKEQWVRISQGCPNRCSFCYEPPKEIMFDIPEIVCNTVKIMDMNLLSKPEAIKVIETLGNTKVNNKVVYYELVCGIDWRFLTPELAQALKEARFKNIRVAWDFYYMQQIEIRKAIKILLSVGYKAKDITIFMVCNWEVPYHICIAKLYLCAIWSVKVADCYFDGQVSPNIEPIGWTKTQIKSFRKKVRKHNQLVGFNIDVEWIKKVNKDLEL